MPVTVRRLKAGDVFTVARIVGRLTADAQAELAANLTARADDGNPLERHMRLGFALFSAAAQHAEQDIRAWLADLAGMDAVAFDAADLDTPLAIIEQLAANEDLAAFFRRAAGLGTRLSGTLST